MYKEVMLDIETLGGSPNGVIISIAAVTFNLGDTDIFNDISEDRTFFTNVDPKSHDMTKFKIDHDTMEWWKEQDPEVFKQLCVDMIPLREALLKFSDFLLSQDQQMLVWGNSPTFDNMIIRMAYRFHGYMCPWHFRDERDYRTLREIVPEELQPKYVSLGSKHHPLADAANQVIGAQNLYKVFSRGFDVN